MSLLPDDSTTLCTALCGPPLTHFYPEMFHLDKFEFFNRRILLFVNFIICVGARLVQTGFIGADHFLAIPNGLAYRNRPYESLRCCGFRNLPLYHLVQKSYIVLLQVFEDEEFARVKGHFGPINSVMFHPDGNSYASGGEDGYVRINVFDQSYFDFSVDY